MTVEFNHTIVAARDKWAAARSLTEILGLPEPVAAGPFVAVQLSNDVSLDFAAARAGNAVTSQHYAFLIDEATFDAVVARLADRDIATFADPGQRTPGHNTRGGGRGLYFDSPDGHLLEVLTQP
jgi:catechol 2,3-dioxygenase-like lactoylglutathione lyase family enzyme